MPLRTNTEDNNKFDTQLQDHQCNYLYNEVEVNDDQRGYLINDQLHYEGAKFHDAGMNTVCVTERNVDGNELHINTGEICHAIIMFGNVGYFGVYRLYLALVLLWLYWRT